MRYQTASGVVVSAVGILGSCGAAMAAPNATNLHDFANRLVHDRSRLVVVADSIWSEDAAGRMPLGVRDTWNIDWFGWTVMASSTATDTLGMVQQAASVPDDLPAPPGAGYGRDVVDQVPPATPPYNFFQPGALSVSPKRYMESRFHGDWTRGAPFWRGVLQNGNPNSSGVDRFAQFRRGTWINPTLGATGIYFQHPSTLSRFELIPFRNGLQTFGGVEVIATGAGVRSTTISCFGIGEPWLQFQKSGSITEHAYDAANVAADSNLVILGAHFEAQGAVRGCSFTTIANAGWSAADHVDTAMCSDANLAGYLNAVGKPNLVLIQLGANAESSEIDGVGNLLPQWKTNVEALIQRYRTILTPPVDGEGHPAPPPLFLLVAQYDLGVNYPRVPGIATALDEIAAANADVSFINLYAFAGNFTGLMANNYLADGVHPTSAGSDYFANHIWIALANAVCPGDTTGDLAVDFLDLNNILSQFGVTAPGQHGDVNNDGVVDFLDLNIVLSTFGTNCDTPVDH